MKKYYAAVATVTDGEKEWDIRIYSHYESYDEAVEGIKRFMSHGYDVIKVWVE